MVRSNILIQALCISGYHCVVP